MIKGLSNLAIPLNEGVGDVAILSNVAAPDIPLVNQGAVRVYLTRNVDGTMSVSVWTQWRGGPVASHVDEAAARAAYEGQRAEIARLHGACFEFTLEEGGV